MTDQVPDNRPTSEKLAHRTIGGCGIVMVSIVVIVIVAVLALTFFMYGLPAMQKSADDAQRNQNTTLNR